jgi:hypothetical protein
MEYLDHNDANELVLLLVLGSLVLVLAAIIIAGALAAHRNTKAAKARLAFTYVPPTSGVQNKVTDTKTTNSAGCSSGCGSYDINCGGGGGCGGD